MIALQTRKLISHTNCLEDIIVDTRKDDYTREIQFKNLIDALTVDDKKNIHVDYYQLENIKQSEISVKIQEKQKEIKLCICLRMAKPLPSEELGNVEMLFCYCYC